jgi:glycosyltransferase involved in cell wall biosynthesis
VNILYTAVCYPPRIGGGELHLHRIAKELAVSGHRVHVINQWSRWRRDWLWGTTVFPDPAKEYRHEDTPVFQLGFPLGAPVPVGMLADMAERNALRLRQSGASRTILFACMAPFSFVSASPEDVTQPGSIRWAGQVM